MIEFCGRSGHRNFAITNLLPRAHQLLADSTKLDENDLRIMSHSLTEWFPNDEDHFRVLDEAATDDWRTDYALEHWIEGFGRHEEEVPDLSKFLSRWWKQGDQGRVRVASTLVRYWGAREDLSSLEGIVATDPDGKLPNFGDIVYDVQRRTAA